MQDGNLRVSGSEFQRTLPEYTRRDLERSVLEIGMLSFRNGVTSLMNFSRKRVSDFSGHKNSLVKVKSFFERKSG